MQVDCGSNSSSNASFDVLSPSAASISVSLKLLVYCGNGAIVVRIQVRAIEDAFPSRVSVAMKQRPSSTLRKVDARP